MRDARLLLQRTLLPKGYEFNKPVRFASALTVGYLAWPYTPFGAMYEAADRYADQKKQRRKQEILEEISESYRYLNVQQAMESRVLSHDEAVQAYQQIQDARRAFEKYQADFLRNPPKDLLKAALGLLHHEQISHLFVEVIPMIQGKLAEDEIFQRDTDLPVVPAQDKVLRLFDLQVQRIFQLDLIERTFSGKTDPKSLDRNSEAGLYYTKLLQDPFAQELINENRRGRLSRNKLTFYLSEDMDWQIRLQQWELLGLSPKPGRLPRSIEEVRSGIRIELQKANSTNNR